MASDAEANWDVIPYSFYEIEVGLDELGRFLRDITDYSRGMQFNNDFIKANQPLKLQGVFVVEPYQEPRMCVCINESVPEFLQECWKSAAKVLSDCGDVCVKGVYTVKLSSGYNAGNMDGSTSVNINAQSIMMKAGEKKLACYMYLLDPIIADDQLITQDNSQLAPQQVGSVQQQSHPQQWQAQAPYSQVQPQQTGGGDYSTNVKVQLQSRPVCGNLQQFKDNIWSCAIKKYNLPNFDPPSPFVTVQEQRSPNNREKIALQMFYVSQLVARLSKSPNDVASYDKLRNRMIEIRNLYIESSHHNAITVATYNNIKEKFFPQQDSPVQLLSGGAPRHKPLLLGRYRTIHVSKGKQYVKIKGKMVLLSKAVAMDLKAQEQKVKAAAAEEKKKASKKTKKSSKKKTSKPTQKKSTK